ncbi:hypothetical protein GH733_003726 [Mirounga leonina]|nr:hypothetical protein GH733_003726 [Mirounga leonina]
MVQAKTSGVKIIRSPYSIKFIRTPQYFKPGMPFYIKVETDEPLWPEEQASANMMAWPYSTQGGSGNILHIEVKTVAEVGSSIYLSLVTEHQHSETKKQITHFTILVLSKDRIVHAKHQSKSDLTVTTIDVTSEMLPSFCILAFYLLPRGTGQDPKLVADSVWVDVNDRCMGTLKVGLKKERRFQTLKPNSHVEVKVTGDKEATVGLVAVDKAVYVLNSKHKLTQKKVWDVVEEYDIGCTAGSLCVSDPFELTVMKSLFVDLKLPSSVVRNEQVQIQAVLYNFRMEQVKVRVEFPHKEALCSASKPEAPSPRAGGQIQQKSHSILLNPQGQTQMEMVPRQNFLNMVPNTEAEVFVSVQGYTHMLTHRSAHGTYHISNGHPGSTCYVFRVFALAYSIMTTGMFDLHSLCAPANWVITKRQAEDGHFLENGPVIMAYMQVPTALPPPGLFKSRALCTDRGGYRGSEADISLTALVLIALDKGRDLCIQEIPNLPASMERARSFLEERLPKINTTFAIAIVSYALALTNSP